MEKLEFFQPELEPFILANLTPVCPSTPDPARSV
jgi:hypothetical protein